VLRVVSVVNVPASQTVHALLPSIENEPATHALHVVLAVSLAKSPALQFVHVGMASVDVYLPTSHAVHVVLALSEEYPFPHE
jgi:hypothetical protein